MATSTSCRSFCPKDHAIICLLATSEHPVSHFRYPRHHTTAKPVFAAMH
jgi:hypothetical protein